MDLVSDPSRNLGASWTSQAAPEGEFLGRRLLDTGRDESKSLICWALGMDLRDKSLEVIDSSEPAGIIMLDS